MNECLSLETIRDFLLDKLNDDQRQAAVEHVENCLTCQQSMEEALDRQTLLKATKDTTSVFPTKSESRFSRVSSSLGHRKPRPTAIDMIPPGELPELVGYEMIAEVGRGASGVVYKAIENGLDRNVAVKIISGQLFSQSDLKQRFLREAKSVAALNHPNIAQLYQISETSKYGPYLVFEFVDAIPLNEIIQERGALNPERAVEICRGIAAAAQHAHDNNMVHRDLKPSNILIEKKSDQPKVIDFGLAVDPAQQSRLTLDSFIAGTPAYMSPEQIQTPREIGCGSDIYSLGVIFYELLTGDVPFRGLSKQTLSRVVNEDPQPLTKLNPDVPRDLETICLKMLGKLPQQRYLSMSDVEAELQRWQQGRPILAKPITKLAVVYRWMLRNPLAASLALIAASLLLIIGIGSTIGVFMLSNANALTRAAKDKSDKAAAAAMQQRDQLLETIDSLVYDMNDDVDLQHMDQKDVQVKVLRIALQGLMESAQNDGEENQEVTRRIGDINLRLASILGRQKSFTIAMNHLNDAHRIAKQLIDSGDAGHECYMLRSLASWEQVNISAKSLVVEQAEFDLVVANQHDAEMDQELMSLEDQLNHCLFKGYALYNLGITYHQNYGENDDALSHLIPANELGNEMVRLCAEGSLEKVENFLTEALGLIYFSAQGLADTYYELGESQKAAEMDYQAHHAQNRLDAYDDGNRNRNLVASALAEKRGEALQLSSLERSDVLYEFLLDAGKGENDSQTQFLNADHHMRRGLVDVEKKQWKLALVHFKDSVAKARGIKIEPPITQFDIESLIAEALLQIIAAKEALAIESSAEKTDLKSLIEKLESIEGLDELEHRILEQIRYEISLLEKNTQK